MSEFISILISFIFMSLAQSVDSLFNNSLSLDAIIVCSSLFSIDLIGRSFGQIGIYTYRVVRRNESSYLLITGIISFIFGAIIFLSSGFLVDLFKISLVQKEMLSGILLLYILYLPCTLIDEGALEMVRLRGNLKLYRKSLIVFYIWLIGLDAFAFIFTKNLFMLYIATILAHIVNIIYLKVKTKMKIENITKEDVLNVKKYGITLSLERLLSRLFILLYGVLASHMGEKKYAIHSICYAVCLNLEIITNAYSATLMIKIAEEKDKLKQINVLKEYMKKCFLLILIINLVMAAITVSIQHGSLPLRDCFPYIIFYSCTVFGLFFYESYKALCVVQGKPKILLYGSIFGVFVRVLVCFIFLNTDINLFIFSLGSLIDFYTRSIIYKKGITKNNNLSINGIG